MGTFWRSPVSLNDRREHRMNLVELIKSVYFDPRLTKKGNSTANITRKIDKYRSDLQGIRALAIIAVLLFHFYPKNFPAGYLGVDQFFVLSGFLMSMMLEREKRLGVREIANFYYRRMRRILPLYLLVILICLIASHFFFTLYSQVTNWESADYALMFTTNIKAADSIRNYMRMLSRSGDLFTHTWSIAVEVQFYMVFPLFFIIYKSIHGTMANLFLMTVGFISLLYHISLPDDQSFNMVHSRLWQFLLGVLVQQFDQKSENSEPKNNHLNWIAHRIQLIMAVSMVFYGFPSLHYLKNRVLLTLLTAGLIHFHDAECSSILSSRCFTYMGKLSYSLYLVHWPIYVFLKKEFPGTMMNLHIGVAIALVASVVLTETFERAYLQASMKTTFSLIIFLYVVTISFYTRERSIKLLGNGNQWVSKMFTPICTSKTLHLPEVCDIPFYAMNLTTEDIIRINEWNSMDDENQLFYSKCSYRLVAVPWGWCDLSPQNSVASHKILVIGNSYAANQGRIVHQSCSSPDVEVRIYSEAGCEVLTVSRQFEHCHESRTTFYETVREYKPDVLFILTRYLKWMDLPMTTSNQTIDLIVNNAAVVLRELSRLVTNRIFVLNAIPYPTRTFEYDHTEALREGKVLDQAHFINESLNLEMLRGIVKRAVSYCPKCQVIDYADVFTVNGTFQLFDDRTGLAYVNGYWHFSYHGLNQLRPFYKQICDEISYTNPSELYLM